MIPSDKINTIFQTLLYRRNIECFTTLQFQLKQHEKLIPDR